MPHVRDRLQSNSESNSVDNPSGALESNEESDSDRNGHSDR
jgi:hypothetical protein